MITSNTQDCLLPSLTSDTLKVYCLAVLHSALELGLKESGSKSWHAWPLEKAIDVYYSGRKVGRPWK